MKMELVDQLSVSLRMSLTASVEEVSSVSCGELPNRPGKHPSARCAAEHGPKGSAPACGFMAGKLA